MVGRHHDKAAQRDPVTTSGARFPTGTAAPLRLHTADLDAAREHTSRTFSQHEVKITGESSLDFRLELAQSPRLTIGQLAYGAKVTIKGPPMRQCYHINIPITGEATAEQGGDRRTFSGGEAGVAFGPCAPLMVRMSADSWQYHVKLPKALLDSHAAKLVGPPLGEDIQFDLAFNLGTEMSQALIETVRFLYAECCRPAGLAPAACREIESALMTQLLLTVPSQLSPALNDRPMRTRRAKIRQAVEYINEHPEDEITTADLAAVAALSPRALQAGFRDLVGVSPTAYLRGVRLDRVHLELASGGSVTDVATRWGFFHLSRFAEQYRKRFGVLPSETARHPRPL